jgi:multiple sugar transport system substrate-binding protein
MLRRLHRAVAIACAAASVAIASTAHAQTALEFPTWQAEEPGVSTWWKELIAAYEKRYPDVRINLQQVPFAQFVKQMTVRFAAGNPPDIVHLPSRDFASFADQGWLEPLDDRLKGTDIAASWPPLQSEMQWNGRTQGVLLMGYGGVLFYNEQKLKDAKLGVPGNPDEWLAAMKATTDAGKGQFGLATITAEHPNMVVEMASWVIGSGADWLKGGKYNMTDPAVVKAVDNWRQSIAYAPKGTNSATARQLFIDGKVTFLRDGPWVWGALAKSPADVRPNLKIGALPFQVTPGGASNSLHLAAKTDAKKKEAAWNFVQMAASPE